MDQKHPSTKDELLSSTPYDDVHRTMVNDCRKWLIPLVSEVFQENLQALMETMSLTAEQALAALKVPEEEYPKYLSMLK